MAVNRKFLFLVGLVIVILILTNLVLYFQNKERQVLRTKMHLIVGDSPGFDTNNDYVVFGRVPPEGASTRHMNLNNINRTNKVHITASGKLADWVGVSENNFILNPNEIRAIDITAFAPSDAEKGDYTGTLIIDFLEVEND